MLVDRVLVGGMRLGVMTGRCERAGYEVHKSVL